MQIIVISGKARHGKDTVAGIMKDVFEGWGKRVLVVHYGDLLKFICTIFFGWDGVKDEQGRHMLQYVGTDIIRRPKPDYWVDFVMDMLRMFNDRWDYVIIPDCRFPNEVNRLVEEGFDTTHIRVIREQFSSTLPEEQQQHLSEIALDDVTPDVILKNNGTIEELRELVLELLQRS